MTMVLSSSLSSSRRFSTRPTLSSRFSIIASAQRVWSSCSWPPPVARFATSLSLKRRQYCSGTAHGECGVLKRLDELKLDDNTIVIYFSDNGPNEWRWNGG